jgi:hypothetical protein
MNLFDGQTKEFRLFDAMRMRFIPIAPRELTEEEARQANEYYVKSFCPHLQWKSEDEQKARNYAIKR